ncbi:uncharacterized protein B0I36DRAFT_332437 [Microdochium trichocladiopsis]|uniref:NmrA-like domain-containing protein n=1 Tax=Microdochium trichocladiopsis TaxID=1682393 RepID=A0A9P8XYT6_9PEZI|nr:uncharacterized protein B0I36DRAFT_332437 [Microdochium trichocladiopsis]KAH7025039.1 hypothetical protein B0I36DRAFT_332437 [Microdochium trichocladiopsis]
MGLPAGIQLKLSDAVILSTQDSERGTKKRYFPWQFGMDYDTIGRGSAQDLFDEQLAVRDCLRGDRTGLVDWTIVSPGLFMSFLFRPDFGVVDIPGRTVRALGSWDEKITITDVTDIGVAVAEAVFHPAEDDNSGQHNGSVLFIAGDTLSYREIADLVDQRFATDGRAQFERQLWDDEALARQREVDGDIVMFKYRSTFAKGKGVAWEKDDTFGAKRGLKMVDVKTYLERLDERHVKE